MLDLLSESDKQLHFICSFLIYIVIWLVSIGAGFKNYFAAWLVPILMAVLVSFSVGLIKELIDPVFDMRDMTANFMGIASAFVFSSPLAIAIAWRLSDPNNKYNQ